MVDSQRVGDSLLDLLLTNKEELDRDVIINSSLRCSDYKELTILMGVKKTSSVVETSGFRRADLSIQVRTLQSEWVEN